MSLSAQWCLNDIDILGHHTTGVAMYIRAVDINAIHTVFVAELADINW